ncbi:MAG: polysaccharide biosynthesis protein [Bacteroidales bacterium]|nr:polysaccharide biosynthesis protein [Bacteroidales bacterium]
MLNRLFRWYFSKSALPYWCVLAIDCAIVFCSGLVAAYLRKGGNQFVGFFWQICLGLLVVVFCYGIGFRLFHTYSGIIRYSSFGDLANVARAGFFGAVLSCAISLGVEYAGVPMSTIAMPYLSGHFIIFLVSVLLMWFVRVIVKTLYDVVRVGANTDRAMIYGIMDGGNAIARYIRSADPVKYDLKGFIAPYGTDEAPESLLAVPVFKDDDNLIDVIKEKGIKAVLVSPLQQDNFPNREKLVEALVKSGVKILMVKQDSEEWDGKSDFKQNQIREVDIEDLLPREKIEVDLNAIGQLIKGKTVMITGAAGSIGYEMARQVAKFAPKLLILIDQAETPMHTVRLHMKNHYPGLSCETIVSSITNKSKMEILFAEHRPDYIFHAAAYKHVPMMEDNPSEAVQNNVYGTRVIADLAVAYGTKKFVMISTDKAVNPTNVMGCSKRICEIYCQSLNRAVEKGEVKMADGNPALTQFITTRFGNVLGSNGSVIPIFRKQILSGGPVTVTHPDIIRFFMLIPEACRLVLEAGTMGHGGEIFVFDMGKPVRIADLAQKMIDLSGAKGVEIKFTGLRDGEKLFEEVLSDKENTKPTVHPKIMVASVREYDYALALKNEKELLDISYKYDDMETVRKMKEIVPEYKSQHSKYQVLD